MYDLILFITNKCNLNCLYCPVNKGDESMLSIVAIKAVDWYLRQPNISKHIRFFGGEPFLAFKEITAVISYAKKKAKELNIILDFDITTNGSLLDFEKIKYFKQNPEVELVLSIDGKKETHLLNRINLNGINGYRAIEENLTNILTINNHTVNMVVSANQVTSFYANFLYLLRKGFRIFNFLPAYYTEWNDEDIENLKKQFNKILKIYNIIKNKITLKNINNYSKNALFNEAYVIDINGDIYINNLVFTTFFKKIKSELKIGNIYSENTKKIFLTDISKILKNELNPNIYNSTLKVDSILTDFIYKLTLNYPLMCCIDIQQGKCDLKCDFCSRHEQGIPYWNLKGSLNSIPYENKVLNEFFEKYGFGNELNIYGRCAIEKNIVNIQEFFNYISKYKFQKIILWSSGVNFNNEDLVKKVAESCITDIEFPVYGHFSNLHDGITGVDGSFEKLQKSIELFKKYSVNINLHTIILKSNYKYVKELINFAQGKKINKLSVLFYKADGYFNYKNENVFERFSVRLEEITEQLKDFRSTQKIIFPVWPLCIIEKFKTNFTNIMIDNFNNNFVRIEFRNNKFRIIESKQNNKNKDIIEYMNCKEYHNCPGISMSYYKLYGGKILEKF